jgi:hypothetical protein
MGAGWLGVATTGGPGGGGGAAGDVAHAARIASMGSGRQRRGLPVGRLLRSKFVTRVSSVPRKRVSTGISIGSCRTSLIRIISLGSNSVNAKSASGLLNARRPLVHLAHIVGEVGAKRRVRAFARSWFVPQLYCSEPHRMILCHRHEIGLHRKSMMRVTTTVQAFILRIASSAPVALAIAGCAQQASPDLGVALKGIEQSRFLSCSGPPTLEYPQGNQDHMSFVTNLQQGAAIGVLPQGALAPAACSVDAVFENSRLISATFSGNQSMCQLVFNPCLQK